MIDEKNKDLKWTTTSDQIGVATLQPLRRTAVARRKCNHGKLKQLIRPVRGFKTLKTAYATIRGFEVMRALRKG